MDFLTSLTLSNYKSILHTEIPLMPLTVLVGRNSAGKTSVLHALEFLRSLSGQTLVDTLQQVGGYESIRTQLVKQDGSSAFIQGLDSITIEITFTTKHDVNVEIGDSKNINVHCDYGKYYLNLQVEYDGNRVQYTSVEYVHINGADSSGKPIRWIVAADKDAPTQKTNYRSLNDADSSAIDIDNGFSIRLFGLEDMPLLNKEPFFLPPLRALLNNCVVFNFDSRRMKEAVPLIATKELSADGANLAVVLRSILSDPEQRESFTHILRYVFPHIATIELQNFTHQHVHLALREEHNPTWALPSSLFSDGTVYMLALIVVLFFDERPIAIIEEPDRYLHPAMMSTLARLLEDASQKKQVIITTHNPLLVKHVALENLLVVHRTHQGETQVLRANTSTSVQAYLESDDVDIADVMIHDMFV